MEESENTTREKSITEKRLEELRRRRKNEKNNIGGNQSTGTTNTPNVSSHTPSSPVQTQSYPKEAEKPSYTTVQTQTDNKDKSKWGCVWYQIILLAGLIWGLSDLTTGLIVAAAVAILVLIPFFRNTMKFLLGIFVGFLGGALSVGFEWPTWACWTIGIVLGLIAISSNFVYDD